MGFPDPDEIVRLTERYAAMPDAELLQLAEDADSLTEAAQQAIQHEIERRGLDDDEPPAADEPRVDFEKLVTIRQFRDLPAALLAKGLLESAGIECFLGDDNMVRMDWFISNLLGGVKLRVRAQDADAANQVLSQPIPDDFTIEGVGEYLQPHCPKCLSLDITFEALNKPIAYTSAFAGVPVPFPKNEWRCDACGHRWQQRPWAED